MHLVGRCDDSTHTQIHNEVSTALPKGPSSSYPYNTTRHNLALLPPNSRSISASKRGQYGRLGARRIAWTEAQTSLFFCTSFLMVDAIPHSNFLSQCSKMGRLYRYKNRSLTAVQEMRHSERHTTQLLSLFRHSDQLK